MSPETVKLQKEKFPFHLTCAIASVFGQSVSRSENVFSVLALHKVTGMKNHLKKLRS